MKEVKKTVKNFDSHNASVKIEALKKEAEQLKQVTELIQTITDSKHIKTVSELDAWLGSKTSFQNPIFSADSMNLKDAYLNVIRLSKGVELTLEDVTASYQLKQSIIDGVNESYSTFYTPAEIETKKELNRIKDEFNALDFDARRSVFIDRSFKIVFNPYSVYK